MTSYTVQPEWKVLVLEDAPERIVWFKERVPDAVYVATAHDAIQALTQHNFRVVFLDHDLHWMHAADNAIVKGTGKEVAMHLKKMSFKGIVVIHSKNEDGARVMLKILPRAKVARFGEFEIIAAKELRRYFR
jgi:CheY-like chemotaxis protein